MKLRYFVSCWGNELDIARALRRAAIWRADGIEGPPPSNEASDLALLQARSDGVLWIAEVATGGNYVPAPHLSPSRHLDDLRRLIETSLPFTPLLINALAGSDAWSFREQVNFFEAALSMEQELGVPIAFETHRSRPTFNPWITRDLLLELPAMHLNCDFSHWCAVCERLVMDEEPELLDLCARRARHIHARVGYDQGPQVPDPRAPMHNAAVDAHMGWWRHIVKTQKEMGIESLSFTPEFGPDGYLQCDPFGRLPVTSLKDLNRWMLDRLRDVMPMA